MTFPYSSSRPGRRETASALHYKKKAVVSRGLPYLFDFCARAVDDDTFQTCQAGTFGSVALRNGDDLAVSGPQPEAERSPLVLIHFHPGVGRQRGILRQIHHPVCLGAAAHRFDALQTPGPGGIDLGCGDGLAIFCVQMECESGGHLTDEEFAHLSRALRRRGWHR